MFAVLDNNKPCDEEGFPQLKGYGWTNNQFDTFNEALIYARKWLGDFLGGSNDGKSGIVLQLNVPYDYSEYGDKIEIKEVN